jgi:hypothetical protein
MELRLTAESIATRLRGGAAFKSLVRVAFFPALTAILAAFIISSMFAGGVRRGIDHAVTWGPESDNAAIAIAISELLHGLDSYVGYHAIAETLNTTMRRGTTGMEDPKLLSNLKNGDLINEAIAAAVALSPNRNSYVAEGTLITMLYDDIGSVDYDKIAFTLFGFKIQSLYYLFFVIISLSSAAFLLQFWRQPVAQAVLLCTLFAFYMELDSMVFSQHVPSYWGIRHGSTLALVPMWHLALLMMYRHRLSVTAAVLALVQIAILVLAIRIRGSAAWTVIFLAGLVVFFAVQAWRELGAGERPLAKVARSALKWPFVLVMVGLLSSKLYTDGRLHPAYLTDDILPYHGIWHSAYLGVFTSPSLFAQTGGNPETWGDRSVYLAAIDYLRHKGFINTEQQYVSPWTRTYKMRLHENTMRAVYLSFVKEHPFSTLAMYVYWKPRQIYYVAKLLLEPIPAITWLTALLGAMALAVMTVLVQRTPNAEMRRIMSLGLAALLFSTMPNIWAYASGHALADFVLSFLAFVALVAWVIWVKLIEWIWDSAWNPLRRQSAR